MWTRTLLPAAGALKVAGCRDFVTTSQHDTAGAEDGDQGASGSPKMAPPDDTPSLRDPAANRSAMSSLSAASKSEVDFGFAGAGARSNRTRPLISRRRRDLVPNVCTPLQLLQRKREPIGGIAIWARRKHCRQVIVTIMAGL